MHSQPAHRRSQAVFCAVGVIGIDFATKLAAQIDKGHRSGLVVPVHNPSFSLGVIHGPRPVELVAMLLGIIAAALYVGRRMSAGRLPGWVAGLLIGGAAANCIDPALSARCTTFWPQTRVVFNVADVAVLIGLIGCAVAAWKQHDTQTDVFASVPVTILDLVSGDRNPKRSNSRHQIERGEVISMQTVRHQLPRAAIVATAIVAFVLETAPRIHAG